MGKIPFPENIFSKDILANLPRDFTLIYDDKNYQCNTALAAILSTKIQIHMLSDVFLNSYSIPDLPDDMNGNLEQISNFLSGQPLEFTNDNVLFLYMISSILGISQIEEKLKDFVDEQLKSTSLKNLIKQTYFLYIHGGDLNCHIKILAKCFSDKIIPSDEKSNESSESSDNSDNDDINKDLFKKIPIPILDLMLQQLPDLIKSGGPKVTSFIISIGGRLLRHVQLNKLTQDQLSDLIKGTRRTNLNFLRQNLSLYFEEKPSKTRSTSTSKRLAFWDNPFNGIINYLAQKCKANPASSKGNLITVTSSTPLKGSCGVNNIFDFSSPRSSFKTEANAEMMFTIDFRNPIVQVDAYSIKTFPQEQGGVQPTTWKLFVSNDNKNWDVIDERKNIILEQCPETTKTFVLLKKTEKIRYVKFLHPPIKNEKYGLSIVSFELFGVYHEK